MVEVTLEGGIVVLEMEDWDSVLAPRSRVEIAARAIRDVRKDSAVACLPQGLPAPGAPNARIVAVRTLAAGGKRVHWDVQNPENAIVIEIGGDQYDQLVVEVADPAAVISMIKSAIVGRPATGRA
ncbi:MAG: hypothetical protein ACLQVD_14685 [Capsulimonadaceae bacterium]